MKSRLPGIVCAASALALSQDRAWACATCFGASDAPMAHGMNMGILSLLVILGSVLAGIAACFITLGIRTWRRAGAGQTDDGVIATQASTLSPARPSGGTALR